MLSFWYYMQHVNTFFDSPIYLPLQEQSYWFTPGWLLGSSFDLFWHVSRQIELDKFLSIKYCVSYLRYFYEHILWNQYRKSIKTILVTLGSRHEFDLTCMFVIVSFRCTLNLYFLIVVLWVTLGKMTCLTWRYTKCSLKRK